MNPRSDIAWSRQLAGISISAIALWAFAGTMTVAAHVAAGWWIMQEPPAPLAHATEAAAIMIELAPAPMAPAAVEDQITPDEVDAIPAEETPVETVEEIEEPEPVEPEPIEPEPVEPEPVEEVIEELIEEVVEESAPVVEEPIDPIEQEIAALDPVTLPVPQARPQPPRPQEVKQEKPRKKAPPKKARQQPSVERRKAQVQTRQEAPRAAARQSNSGAASSSVSPARWQARVASHLERRKRYPTAARRQRQEGTAHVRFTIDGSGNVQSVSLTRSSGVPALDEEVVALVRRASPVPAPPPGVSRTIVVPIRFNVR